MNNLLSQLLRKAPDHIFFNRPISAALGFRYAYSDKHRLFEARSSLNYHKSYHKDPRVFVYVPTYNRCEYLLERSLPSILRQTYKNISVLVVDDGSTDNTKQAIEKAYGSRIKVVTCERKRYRYPNKSFYHWLAGPVEAANIALAKCDGDWIARLDDDDEWHENHIESNLTFALQNKLEFVSSQYQVIPSDGDAYVVGADEKTQIGGTQTWLYHGALNKIRYNINCWRKSHNRVNDTDLQYRLYQAGTFIGFNNTTTCTIRPRKGELFVGSKAYIANPAKYEAFYQ